MGQLGVGTFETLPKMEDYVMEVLMTGRISYGPFCRQFERDFARRHACRFGVVFNSGTDALRVALAALKEADGWDEGDEVIVPATTFVATVNVVLDLGLTPVLADVDARWYTLDPGACEEAITDRTRCIMPVHVFGQPAEMPAISDVAQRYGLRVVEDSCEAMFVRDEATPVGAWGDIGCFSTYVAHLLTTGVGGIATTNQPGLHDLMRSYANHGRDGIYTSIDDDAGKRGDALRQVVTRRFSFVRRGYSARMTELEAALACGQLDAEAPDAPKNLYGDTWVEWMLGRRRENALALTAELELEGADEWLVVPEQRDGAEHSWMMYPLVLRDPDRHDKFALMQSLEEAGIETREMLPLTNQPVYADRFDERCYPAARWINRAGFYVGCHQGLSPADMRRIATRIVEWYRQEATVVAI